DLYYRLNQFVLTVPPLRDRGEDILLLSYYFLEKYRLQYPDKEIADFSPQSLRIISSYEWPGNVRQLASAIHKAVITAQSPIVEVQIKTKENTVTNLDQATRNFQLKLINRVLDMTGGNKDQAAGMLGIHRSTLFRYLNPPAK
ncbi:MAG: sigma-54-dependent Fis family transcriptional regulator, partial [Chitinivibrionales bacterium]|nr:sigma-54-dependent Fis family transcriptional regulator [Chitinivibrionales bacterium]